jgi:hypothetical protein
MREEKIDALIEKAIEALTYFVLRATKKEATDAEIAALAPVAQALNDFFKTV